MSQSEINEVVAAVEALVRRAYTLGRRDGLRHLVKYANRTRRWRSRWRCWHRSSRRQP